MQFPERICKRQHHAPYVEEIGCKCRQILAENKTMLIIPDLAAHESAKRTCDTRSALRKPSV